MLKYSKYGVRPQSYLKVLFLAQSNAVGRLTTLSDKLQNLSNVSILNFIASQSHIIQTRTKLSKESRTKSKFINITYFEALLLGAIVLIGMKYEL